VDRKSRITKNEDFKKIKNSGDAFSHPLLKMAVLQNGLNYSRYAVITSKMVGNAVKRNRCKRRMKAIIHLLEADCKAGWDVIFIIRKEFNQAESSEIQAVVKGLLRQAGLLEVKE